MSDLATYVYCVVVGDNEPRAKAPKGLPGARTRPRRIDVGDGYQAVVASVPLSLYSAEAIEAKLSDLDWVGAIAASHEAVVEHAASGGTVIPMKLFTLFSSDERAAEHVRKTKKALDRVVARIGGCQEWGLRVLVDDKAPVKAPAKRPTSGTGFLLAKREIASREKTRTDEARKIVQDLYDRLEKGVRAAAKRPAPTAELSGRVLLDAVFLVPEKTVPKFTKAVAATAEGLAEDGFHVSLTGPWPAYSFVEAR